MIPFLIILQVNVKEELGQVFKIRVGLAELPDTAQYWTLDSVRRPQIATASPE